MSGCIQLTELERNLAMALSVCNFRRPPHRRFVEQMARLVRANDAALVSPAQRMFLRGLSHSYRRQLPEGVRCVECHRDENGRCLVTREQMDSRRGRCGRKRTPLRRRP